MTHSKIKYLLIPILLVILLSESCSTGSKGLFEKRKHLKGWHFHKQASSEKNSTKSSLENKFKKDNEETQAIHFKKQYQNKVSSLEVLESNSLANTTENKKLIGISSNKHIQLTSKQKKLEKESDASKSIDKQAERNPTKSDKKSTNNWSYNGAYFFLLMLFPLAMRNKRPNEIQVWAARNKAKSRTLLVIAKILLATTSISLGFLLGVPFSLPLLLLSVVILIVTIGSSEYWKKKNQLTNKKKLGLLGVLNTTTSFGFFSLGGMLQNSFDFSQWSIINGLLKASPNIPEQGFVYDPFYLTVSTILLTLVLVILVYLISILSCWIYCSSYELVGSLIFTVGNFMLLFAYFYLIIKLFRKEVDTEIKKRKRYIISMILAGIGIGLFWLYMFLFNFYPVF